MRVMGTDSHAEYLTEWAGPFRINSADKAALRDLAKRNDRTEAAEIRLAIKDRLKKERAK